MEIDLKLIVFRLRQQIERARINQKGLAQIDPKGVNSHYWEGRADALEEILKQLVGEVA